MTHSQQLGQLAFVTMLCHALALVVTTQRALPVVAWVENGFLTAETHFQ